MAVAMAMVVLGMGVGVASVSCRTQRAVPSAALDQRLRPRCTRDMHSPQMSRSSVRGSMKRHARSKLIRRRVPVARATLSRVRVDG